MPTFNETVVINNGVLQVNGPGNSYFLGGSVGIGTTSPWNSLLQLESQTDHAQLNIWSNAAGKFATLMLGTAASGLNAWLFLDDSDGQKLKIVMGDSITEPPDLTMEQGGYVGLGVTVPQARLHLAEGSSIYLSDAWRRITEEANASGGRDLNVYNSTGANPNGSINFKRSDAAATWLTIRNDGNVGIGTTDPQAKLHVAGQLKLDGALAQIRGQGNVGLTSNAFDDLINNFNGAVYWFKGTQGGGSEGGGAQLMKLDTGGNLGIGVANPNQGRLMVAQDVTSTASLEAGQIMALGAGDNAKRTIVGYDTLNNRGFISAGRSLVAWDNLILQAGGGSVGIGTTDPQAKLEVAGGAVRVGGREVINAQGYALYAP